MSHTINTGMNSPGSKAMYRLSPKEKRLLSNSRALQAYKLLANALLLLALAGDKSGYERARRCSIG